MSMSTHVVGFSPPDDKWKKMKAVWDASHEAGIAVPEEVAKFFNYIKPDKNGVEFLLENTPCCQSWRADCEEGFEIDISKLPPHVTVIRFYNSY